MATYGPGRDCVLILGALPLQGDGVQPRAYGRYPAAAGREFPKLERIAVALCGNRLGIPFLVHGFRRRVSRAVETFGPDDGEELAVAVREFPFLPDGFGVVRGREAGGPGLYHVYIVEVEDTSRLTDDKLHAYVDLWDVADCTDHWAVHLVVTDRYGRGDELSLGEIYVARLTARNHEAARMAPARTPGGDAARAPAGGREATP